MFATPVSLADDTTGADYVGVATYVSWRLEATGTASTAELRTVITVIRRGAGRYEARIQPVPRRLRRAPQRRPAAPPARAPRQVSPRAWARDWRLRALPRRP